MREELTRLSGTSPTVKWMLDNDIPLTREAYLDLAYDQMPEEWTAEHELGVPAPFRKTTS